MNKYRRNDDDSFLEMPTPNEQLLSALTNLTEISKLAVVKTQNNLAEAVKKLQELFADTLVDHLKTSVHGLTPLEMSFAREGDRISAMRHMRQRLDIPVSEAKAKVEKWQKKNGVDPSGGQR